MNKIRRLIRWFIPVGLAVKLIRNYDGCCHVTGQMRINHSGHEMSLDKAWETPFRGVFLVYSKERHNNELNWEIAKLNVEIKKLEGCLK